MQSGVEGGCAAILIGLLSPLGRVILDATCQFVLSLGFTKVYSPVISRSPWPAILDGFDRGSANLLPPSDVRPPERVRSESSEIASLCLGCLMESVAHTRVPERLPRCPLLLKNKGVRSGTVFLALGPQALDEITDSQDPFPFRCHRRRDPLWYL